MNILVKKKIINTNDVFVSLYVLLCVGMYMSHHIHTNVLLCAWHQQFLCFSHFILYIFASNVLCCCNNFHCYSYCVFLCSSDDTVPCMFLNVFYLLLSILVTFYLLQVYLHSQSFECNILLFYVVHLWFHKDFFWLAQSY